MKVWNFGIIGAGLIADFHAKAIQSLDNAKLVGICGTNQDKAQNSLKNTIAQNTTIIQQCFVPGISM